MNILQAIVSKYRHILLSSALALTIVVIVASMVYAAYRVDRPITTTGGVVNQSYLWGESSGGSTHKGVDFSYGLGTSVYAVADGVVKDVVEFYEDGSTADGGFGNLVLIKHNTRHYVRQNNGQTVSQMGYVYSIYAHLRKNSVIPNEGDAVTAGQRIAEVDDTGNSSGNHLHLQVVLDQSPDHNNGADYSWTEIASRNPELWLQPFSYGTQTTTAIGKLTDTAGNPVGGKLIVGIEKPAAAGGDPTGCGANGYGSSLTYNYTWTNPDDILGENFGTTDVAPGTYHLYAYDTFDYQTCQGTLYRDLGNYIFSTSFPTYIGLYPVHFPNIEAYNWFSVIYLRNNSSTSTAEVRTSFFQSSGSVSSQDVNFVAPTSKLSVSPLYLPPGTNTVGTATVVGSQDIATVAVSTLTDSATSYSGILPSGDLGTAGWERGGTDIALPLLMDNNSGWSSRIFIRNISTSYANYTLTYYDQSGNAYSGGTGTLAPNVSLQKNQFGTSMPTIGSGRITSDQPLAVLVEEYKSPSYMTYNAFSGSSSILDLPLLMANNNGWYTGIAVRNTSSSATTVTVTYYPASGYPARNPESLTAPAGGSATFTQIGGQWGSAQWIGSAVVSTNPPLPIVGIVNQITTTGPPGMNYSAFLHGTPLAVLADIRNNVNGWTSGLTIQNVGSSSASVTLRVNGATAWSGTIAAKSQQSFYPVPNTSSGFSGTATVESTNGQPIVAVVNHLKSGSGDLAMSYNGVNR